MAGFMDEPQLKTFGCYGCPAGIHNIRIKWMYTVFSMRSLLKKTAFLHPGSYRMRVRLMFTN